MQKEAFPTISLSGRLELHLSSFQAYAFLLREVTDFGHNKSPNL